MSTIWKFPLRLTDGDQLVRTMPRDAIPVRLAMQNGVPTLWCLVNEKNSQEDRRFVIVGTGHPIPDGCEYIGSCDDGAFVWHALERFSSGKLSMTNEEVFALSKLFEEFSSSHCVTGVYPDAGGRPQVYSGQSRMMDRTMFVLAVQEFERRSKQHCEQP